MKRFLRLASVLTILGMLAGCAAETPGAETEPAESNMETEMSPAVNYGRENREIADAYRTIEPAGEHDVKILFLAAGKADSTLLLIDDAVCLIDTGISASPAKLIPAMKQLGADRIDHLFLTHTHNDHIGGYEYLAEVYDIGTVHTSSISMNMALLDKLVSEKEHLRHDPGDVISLTDGVWMEVLGPVEYNGKDDNDNSMVLRLRVNGMDVLFAADMKFAEEESLLGYGMIGDCDILKVGHHGKNDACSEGFLTAAKPEYAVISTDRDVEKDTADETVIARLKTAGAEVFVTDEYGLGLLADIAYDGTIAWSEMKPERETEKVKLEKVSKSGQYVILKNKSGRDVDISCWLIYSDRGNEYFVFPQGAVIPGGGTVTVGCREYDGTADYEWNAGEVWHSSKKDKAYLYDSFGNAVDDKKSE